jgi:hypothetical protein
MAEILRNCTCKPRNGRESRRDEAASPSSDRGGSIAHSKWSIPGDSNVGSARISTLRTPKHWFANACGIACTARGRSPAELYSILRNPASARPVRRVFRSEDMRAALPTFKSIITNPNRGNTEYFVYNLPIGRSRADLQDHRRRSPRGNVNSHMPRESVLQFRPTRRGDRAQLQACDRCDRQ